MKPAAANRVVHLELHTAELADARTFYRELLGWRAEGTSSDHAPYVALELGERLSGGIVECPIERTLWLPYVDVIDVHRATDDASTLGASVLLSPREGPS